MSHPDLPQKTIALIIDAELPHPLNILALKITEKATTCYLNPYLPSNYTIQTLDLKEFNLSIPSNSTKTNYNSKNEPDLPKTLQETEAQAWNSEISKHVALIVLHPFHIWSQNNALKNALSILPPSTLNRKPIMLMSYGKEEISRTKNGELKILKIMRNKSTGMLREFVMGLGMRVVEMERMPEIMIYEDYWRLWEEGRLDWFWGEQVEVWEGMAWDWCQVGVGLLIDEVDGRRRGKRLHR